jgi:hypothetical protein
MKPVLQALVLAERIYETKDGRKIICGTFNRLESGFATPQEIEGPGGGKQVTIAGGTDMGCPSAYVSLTDIVGEITLVFQFVSVSRNVSLFQIEAKVSPLNRLETAEFILDLPPLRDWCREIGVYSLDVLCDNEILGSHRLTVEPYRPPLEQE